MTENKKNLKTEPDINLENFDITEARDSCHFVCQNLSIVNILLIIILFFLGYMFIEQTMFQK